MADASEVQALRNISAEVEDSQIKVILSTQCIKAQSFLADKLRKQAERNKERCSFISSANLRLQSEITQAQQEIKSLLISHENIKQADVELKKELLIAKEKKLDVIERITNGEKKYEALWNESKSRYESLPFVQKLLNAKAEVLRLEQEITKLEGDKNTLYKQIEIQKETCYIIDRKRIIEMAEFITNERPKIVDIIKKKTAAIKGLMKELEILDIKAKADVQKNKAAFDTVDKDVAMKMTAWPLAQNFEDNILTMPQLQLSLLDFDALSAKLDQVKIKRIDSLNNTPESITKMEVNANKVDRKSKGTEEYIASFFNKPSVYEKIKPKNYARMKLINILEDVKIDRDRAQELVSKVNPDTLLQVESISVDTKKADTCAGFVKSKEKKPIMSEHIEEIDLTLAHTENLLIPPTQFLDISSELQVSQKDLQEKLVTASVYKEELHFSGARKSSQEELNRKRVSFELPTIVENNIESGAERPDTAEDIDANETINSQLDASDEGYSSKIKDMIMKQQHLDLSPQFVYTKNIMCPLNLENNDDVITSKFFQQKQKISKDILEVDMEENVTAHDKQNMQAIYTGNVEKAVYNPASTPKMAKYSAPIDIGGNEGPSPKRPKIHETSDKPVTGFMFGHGAQINAESMNVSISTTGFEEGDADYPQCLDTSLLLSPKADIPMPVTADSQDVVSQDVPNFLTGLRKTGFSFFGGMPSSEPKPDSSAQNQASGFNFNFGSEHKKSRGGFFNMFK